MIFNYTARNFYSINHEMTVRFDVNNKVPESHAYVNEAGQRLSAVEAIVGSNASGKTNAIKALGFIKHLIAETAERDVDADIPMETFQNSDAPTEMSVKFSVDERVYLYEFVLCRERILKESLREQSRSDERLTYKTLLAREWKKDTYEVVDNAFNVSKNLQYRRNASMVSRIWLVDEDGLAGDIVRYWRDCVVHNVWKDGNLDDNATHSDRLTRSAIRFLYSNSDLMERAKSLLRLLDIGFYDFEREELKIEGRDIYKIKHQYKDRHFSNRIDSESSGTKRAIVMLRYVLDALSKEGGFAALDEFDAYLHPDIVEALVKLFMSPETNPHGSQLVFSSHSHQLLAELDKQQITLVEKNEQGETEIWRLDDVTGVRADDNYFTKYIAGAYSAKPRLKL